MFYEKVKYNTLSPEPSFGQGTLPFRQRQPKSYMKLTFNTGGSLSILTNVFRAIPQITQILQDEGKVVQGGALRAPPGARGHCSAHVAHGHFGAADGRGDDRHQGPKAAIHNEEM